MQHQKQLLDFYLYYYILYILYFYLYYIYISITGGRTGAVEATGTKKKRHWSKGEIFPISRVTRRDLSRMVRSIPLN